MKLAFIFRKTHKWIALIVGAQALIWVVSGLYMTAIHIDYIHGDHLVVAKKPEPLMEAAIKPLNQPFLGKLGVIKSIKLSRINGKNLYLINADEKLVRVDAESLAILPEFDDQMIKQIALSYYAGSAQISAISLLEQHPPELGSRPQPVWQVTFDDWLESTLYFNAQTGELRSKRSNLWRWFDFLWMLHIMDYESRADINNWLLRAAASLGTLLAISGIGLLVYSFRQDRSSAV